MRGHGQRVILAGRERLSGSAVPANSRMETPLTELPVWFEITSLIVLSLIIVFDLILAYKRPHIPSVKESSLWIAFYVSLALIFAALMFLLGYLDQGGLIVAGGLTEYSLSIHMLSVFII